MVHDYDVIMLWMTQPCIPALQFSFSSVYSNVEEMIWCMIIMSSCWR